MSNSERIRIADAAVRRLDQVNGLGEFCSLSAYGKTDFVAAGVIAQAAVHRYGRHWTFVDRDSFGPLLCFPYLSLDWLLFSLAKGYDCLRDGKVIHFPGVLLLAEFLFKCLLDQALVLFGGCQHCHLPPPRCLVYVFEVLSKERDHRHLESRGRHAAGGAGHMPPLAAACTSSRNPSGLPFHPVVL